MEAARQTRLASKRSENSAHGVNEFCPRAKRHFSDSQIPDLLVPLRNCTWPDDSSQHASQCCSDDLDPDREDPQYRPQQAEAAHPGHGAHAQTLVPPPPRGASLRPGAGLHFAPLCSAPGAGRALTFALHSRDARATLRGWKLGVSLSRQTGLHLPARVMRPRYHFINKERTGFHSKAA